MSRRKWEGPPEDGLLYAKTFYRKGDMYAWIWVLVEARDPEYIESLGPEDKEVFHG